jgi:hydroxymethylglutaryl-CoA reductase (NADPH)
LAGLERRQYQNTTNFKYSMGDFKLPIESIFSSISILNHVRNKNLIMKKHPIVPGRGLNTENATNYRLDFLKANGIDVPLLADSQLHRTQIQHNIESYIGSVEIPIGLAGPLLFNQNSTEEYVYAPVGTLEGALVASINRGAKVVTQSGGFNAVVVHQKMVRSPMFVFRNLTECVGFKTWIDNHFEAIKAIAEQYSNHANLEKIDAIIASRSVHLKFVYTTGDASGQNMTTTCTWHSVLWINANFKIENSYEAVHYVIEGNGASDKKLSNYSASQGRGVHVIAECELLEHEIQKVLRVSSDDFLRCLSQSLVMSKLDGMFGYNINVSNAIAGIFVATGQDLASIHESGTGILNMEKTEKGLYCSLHLPSLVIGTLGGGTHLSKQKEGLMLMDCQGNGKVERFAKLIAGFALSLEISTFGAIVGGQFAKAHEKLGRNKPVNWLIKGEIKRKFIAEILLPKANQQLKNIQLLDNDLVKNGIIISLTSRVNKKLTGFFPIETTFENSLSGNIQTEQVLIKSKPLDTEVIQGLHFMAASIEPILADLLFKYRRFLEYQQSHLKEIRLYQLLHEAKKYCIPSFLGSYENPKREIFIFIQELLNEPELLLFNTENQPELWQENHIKSVIETINKVHQYLANLKEIPTEIQAFEPWKSTALYHKFAEIIALEYDDTEWRDLPLKMVDFINELETLHDTLNLPKTIIHNDFNPRNIALRKDERVCIYDWELAVIDIPHRDIIEFLSFVLPLNFDKEILFNYLEYPYSLQTGNHTWSDWKAGYVYALKSFLVTRVSFYMTGKIIVDYPFAERVFLNGFRMIDMLSNFSTFTKNK